MRDLVILTMCAMFAVSGYGQKRCAKGEYLLRGSDAAWDVCVDSDPQQWSQWRSWSHADWPQADLVYAEPQPDQLVLVAAPVCTRVSFQAQGETITIGCDGKVDVPPGVKLDDAAKAFWKAVEQMGLSGCAEKR